VARVQFASDLHLEFGRGAPLEIPLDPATDVLVLAGDLHPIAAKLEPFIRVSSSKVPVILVAGNHDLFGQDITSGYRQLEEWAQTIHNCHFLQNRRVELSGVTFIGATLWTDFAGADPDVMQRAPTMMTEFFAVKDLAAPKRRLTSERLLAMHRESVAYLEGELHRCDRARTVVVTHHAPSFRSRSEKGELWDPLYASDCEALIERCGPALWIHGHVHSSFDYRIADTRIVCNPRGYVGHALNEGFDPGQSVEI
jgi:Icc-related predicted phosphoesterase